MAVGTKAGWLYGPLGAIIVLSYIPLRDRLSGEVSIERINVSNITFNLLLTFFIFGFSASYLAEKLWPSGPKWKSWVAMSVMVLLLIWWMTVWGYETRIGI